MCQLTQITEELFYSLQVPCLFSNEEIDKCYGILSKGNFKVKFSWHSDLIIPDIKKIKDDIYSIGIDQNFVLTSLKNFSIILKLNLSFNYFEIKIMRNSLLVITELEVIEINKDKLAVINEYSLPDIFEKIHCGSNDCEIICANGDVVKIDIPNNP